ncbi:MAG: Na+/H+ antiporter NhaA [Propionibacteriaceae bacterium]|nr:Na+/H+ antiporter NhaA [Propionibacteriaceae bacterium]
MSGERKVLATGSYGEYRRVRGILQQETTSGALLLLAAALAMVFANVAPQAYLGLRDLEFGPVFLGIDLHMSLGHWAADGLLAIFFFLVGLELKREFVAGDLSDPKTAIVPIAAAFGGVAGPAIIYLIITWGNAEAMRGWAVPVATDIAFAVGVLAVIGSHLPAAMRTFLLTLAVADDLIGIAIIAIAYATELRLEFLAFSLIPMLCFLALTQFGRRFIRAHKLISTAILSLLAVTTWALFFNSGIHATISGVILGFLVPVGANGHGSGLAQSMEERVRPISTAVAAPVFAFFSAGVALGGWDGFVATILSPIGLGIIIGLPLGKTIGIFTTTWLVTRLEHANLDPKIRWIDVFGLAVLGGMGFTVALLVCELSFGQGTHNDDIGKVGIITASILSACIASVILGQRSRHYKAVAAAERIDANADGVPDAFERP